MDEVYLRPGGTGGTDGLGMAIRVFLNKPVSQPKNLRRGAVIFLHQQHTGAGIGLLKLHQGGGIRGPEAVNALILVPHHKEVPGLLSQKVNDGVLDPGGVLRFVHADIGKRILKMGQPVRVQL